MLTINATLDGEDYQEINIAKQEYTYSGLCDTLKKMFWIEKNINIEVYDSSEEEISKITFIPNTSNKLKIALINKEYELSKLAASSNNISQQNTELSGVIRDEVSKHKFSCHYKTCRKTFKFACKLFNHIKIHFKNKPFVWSFPSWNKSFLWKGQLRNHQSTHVDTKKFTCGFEGWDKSYSKKSRLIVHERVHTGERPFVCRFKDCNKSFAEKGNLKTHFRTHTGEKPYVCSFDDCGKRFTTQGHLVDHERRHRAEKPFRCQVWRKSFMRSSTLKVHMKTHKDDDDDWITVSNISITKEIRPEQKVELNIIRKFFSIISDFNISWLLR